MPAPTSSPSSLNLDYAAILRGMWRRHKMLMVAVFLAIAIPAATVMYYVSRPVYVSTALITMEVSVLDQMPQFREFAKRDSLGSLLILMKSRSFATAVVEALPKESFDELTTNSQYTDYMLLVQNRLKTWFGKPPLVMSPQDRAIVELQNARMEFVSSLQTAGVLVLKASASRPRVATDLVNTYIQVLLSRTRSSNQEEAAKTREFLEQQVQQTKENLTQAEIALSKFQQQKGRTTPGAQPEDLDALSKLESALAEAQANREVVWAQVSVLRQSVAQQRARAAKSFAEAPGTDKAETGAAGSPADSVARFAAFKAAQERLAKLEVKLAALRERYTEAHPLVQATHREVLSEQARVTQLARDLPPAVVARDPSVSRAAPSPAAVRADAQQQLAALEAEGATLQVKIETLKVQVDRLKKTQGVRNIGQEEAQLNGLQRGVEVNRNLLSVLTDKLLTARIRQQGEVGVVRVLDPASFPFQTTQSARPILVVLALAGGLACGAAFGLEFYRLPVETEADVLKATGLPLLGSVGVIEAAAVAGPPRRREQPLFLPMMPSGVPSAKYRNIHVDLYRAIRANVETERLKVPFRSIMITSPGPHEGKSTTTVNLAHVFREFGHRVLMIEADLRRPAISAPLGLTNKPSLVDYLQGTATLEQVCRPLPSGVVVMPSQVARGDAASLLGSPRLKELLRAASAQFDLILVDCAPVLAVPDNLLLAHLVDRVILVASASGTSVRELRNAQKAIVRADGKILGVVLNRAHPRDVSYYHPRYRKYYSPSIGREPQESVRRPGRPSPERDGKRSTPTGRPETPAQGA